MRQFFYKLSFINIDSIVDEEEMNLGSDSGDDGSFSDEDFSEGEPIDFGEDE